MYKFKKYAPILALILWDILSVVFSVLIGFRLSYWTHIPWHYQHWLPLYITGVSGVMLALNALCGCYMGAWRNISFTDLLKQVSSVLLGVLALFVFDAAAVRWIEGMEHLERETIIILGMAMLLFMLAGRLSVRLLLSARAKMKAMFMTDMKRVVVYGGGETGNYLLRQMRGHPDMGLLPVAIADDDPAMLGKKIQGVRVRGGMDKLNEIIQQSDADEVIVAIHDASRQLMQDVLECCRSNRCNLRRFGTIDQPDLSKASVSDINLEDLLRRDSIHLNMGIVKEMIEGKTVLVTGGCGSIGSEICRQVLGLGCAKLVIVDFHENGLFFLDNELKEKWSNGEYAIRLGSVRDRKRLEEIFEEFHPEIVFHAAAHKHVPMMEINPCEAIKNNVCGTINTAQTAIAYQVKKFILISTDKAVNPTNIMGASKRITELVIQMMDTISTTEFAAVRFGNVLGSNGSVVPFFRKQIAAGGPVTVTHPEMKRFFMTIPEAVQLVLEAGAMAHGGEIFVLDMGEQVKIVDLARDLIRLSGYEPDVDIKIVFTGLRPGEKLYEEITMANEDFSKTANNKIYVMKPIDVDPHDLAFTIKQLEKSAIAHDNPSMFSLVKELVPTFNHNKGK